MMSSRIFSKSASDAYISAFRASILCFIRSPSNRVISPPILKLVCDELVFWYTLSRPIERPKTKFCPAEALRLGSRSARAWLYAISRCCRPSSCCLMFRLFSNAMSMHSNSVYCRWADKNNVPATSKLNIIAVIFIVSFFFVHCFHSPDLVVLFQSVSHFNAYPVGQANGHGVSFERLRVFALHEVDKGGVTAELHGALGDGDHLLAPVEDDIGIGAVACADKYSLGQLQGRLHLEQDGATLFHSLGRDILQRGGNGEVLDSPDGDFHGHPYRELADLGLVDLAHEKHVAQVGHRGDGGAVVEIVGLDHRVPRFNGHVEDGAAHGGAYQRVTRLC